MLKYFLMFLIIDQICELVLIRAYLKKFLWGTGIGKYLVLLRLGFTIGMSLPKLISCWILCIRLITKVRLVRKIVSDVEIIPNPHHPFMVLVNMPVMLSKNHVPDCCPGIF